MRGAWVAGKMRDRGREELRKALGGGHRNQRAEPKHEDRSPQGARRMQDRDQIRAEVTAALVELFEIEPERITAGARLYEDLEIDSIDAIDLMDRLRQVTGRKISAEQFRSVRTIGDLVEAVHLMLSEA